MVLIREGSRAVEVGSGRVNVSHSNGKILYVNKRQISKFFACGAHRQGFRQISKFFACGAHRGDLKIGICNKPKFSRMWPHSATQESSFY